METIISIKYNEIFLAKRIKPYECPITLTQFLNSNAGFNLVAFRLLEKREEASTNEDFSYFGVTDFDLQPHQRKNKIQHYIYEIELA